VVERALRQQDARLLKEKAMLRKSLVVLMMLSSVLSYADTPPAKIRYVGAISINPSQDAKVLADWYAGFGIATKEYHGGYYGKFDTPAGPFVFGVHPKKANAPKQSSASVSIVFGVDDFDASLKALKAKGITPVSTEKDGTGRFAHFVDPDGNEVTIWAQPS
jgi:predicted enzyme related to lactoylglutathione lyase